MTRIVQLAKYPRGSHRQHSQSINSLRECAFILPWNNNQSVIDKWQAATNQILHHAWMLAHEGSTCGGRRDWIATLARYSSPCALNLEPWSPIYQTPKQADAIKEASKGGVGLGPRWGKMMAGRPSRRARVLRSARRISISASTTATMDAIESRRGHVVFTCFSSIWHSGLLPPSQSYGPLDERRCRSLPWMQSCNPSGSPIEHSCGPGWGGPEVVALILLGY